MVFPIILAVAALVGGLALLIFSSDKGVEHSIFAASALRISPLMMGLMLVSLGTDLPEIANSIASSALGHGEINVGDSLGSAFTQISLVLGLIAFLSRGFKVKRKEVAVIGGCVIIALMLAVSVADVGYMSRINSFFLVSSWIIFMIITRTIIQSDVGKEEHLLKDASRSYSYHLLFAILSFIGVAVGAYIVTQSVIVLSEAFGVTEYVISFFVVAIGTSLPELVVDVTAIRKKQYELALGDILGSCMVDASFSIGIGPLFFPVANLAAKGLIVTTGLYTILVSIIIISLLALREKVDKKAGALFIVLYALSYLLLYVP